MRGPILIFLAPLISQFMERTESSSGGQSPRTGGLGGSVPFASESVQNMMIKFNQPGWDLPFAVRNLCGMGW